MIKNILGADFKYEEDKIYKLHSQSKTKWRCCNDLKPNKGYIRININNKLYYLHRIIYKYFNEDWDITYSTNNQIDHININSLDNRIENIRVVNNSQNQRNKNKKKNCSSKFIGVCWHKKNRKWRAKITINGKDKHLGTFDNEEEAHLVYKKKYDEIMDI
tara:strand:+ start:872 stop:1351 length:480 start_codon:yes stop_codon:yes gene_type:complete